MKPLLFWKPLLLCRERLERILTLLDRYSGEASLRDLYRSHTIFKWEVKQAAELGWLTIEPRKPPIGRPSIVAKKVSISPTAKLPPPRHEIPREISIRHERFAHEYLMSICRARRAYVRVFPNAGSEAGASASAHRLLNHPDVKATIAWIRACMDAEFPRHEKATYPNSAAEIRKIFRRLGYWRFFQL